MQYKYCPFGLFLSISQSKNLYNVHQFSVRVWGGGGEGVGALRGHIARSWILPIFVKVQDSGSSIEIVCIIKRYLHSQVQ